MWMEGQPTGGQSLGTFPSLVLFPLGFFSAELCRPILVCPLEGPQGVRGRECFLRVTSGHLFEVELQAARTLERLELQSLEAAEIEPETQAQREPLPEVSVGVGLLEGRWAFSGASSANMAPGCWAPGCESPWSLRGAEGVPGGKSGPRWLGRLAQESSFWARVDISESILVESRAIVSLCAQYNPNSSALFSGPLFPCRAQSPAPRPRSSPCAFRTFARTGTCVAMWCWSPMPKRLSR